MSVPILKLGSTLIASVQEALTDAEIEGLRVDLSERVGRLRAESVVIDVGLVDVLDSYATRALKTIEEVLRLRGARTVVVGIQPVVALAMVRMGLSLEGLDTALDLEEGLRLLRDGDRTE